MRVYIVDDEESKAASIDRFVEDEFPTCSRSSFRSFQSGLKAIITSPPDILLLDMTMPTFDVGARDTGGRQRRYAGKEIIRQMHRRGVRVPVIIITQYEQFQEDGREIDLATLKQELESSFSGFFVDAIYYNVSDNSWKSELRRSMRSIILLD